MQTENKRDAHAFLAALENRLQSIPDTASMRAEIRNITHLAKRDSQRKHLRIPEAAFLNTYAIPALHRTLVEVGGLSPMEACAALLNEYHRNMKEYSSRSPIRATRHPFTKVLDTSADSIYRRWKEPSSKGALTQSAPDFATLAPHRILFEGKYFSSGSAKFAARELVRDIYQVFFYRGLPAIEETKKHPSWNYDYACLLAYDASSNGTLRKSWAQIDPKVKASFWDGANVYVMILGG